MEKRFALFLILSALILFTHLTVQNFLHPPQADQPPAEVAEGGDGQAKPKAKPEPAKKGPEAGAAKLEKQPAEAAAKQPAEAPGPALAKGEPTAAAAPPRVEVPKQWVTLGSMAPDSPYRLMVTLQNTGAAVERIEMVQRTGNGQFRFLDLEQNSGYLGYLALEDTADGKGCRVNVVGPGTPAADAKAQNPAAGEGLRAGDVIRRIDSFTVRDAIDLKRYLAGTKPGQTVQIAVVRRRGGVRPKEEILTATLAAPPLSIVRPDGQFEPDRRNGRFAVLPVHAGKHRGHVHRARR